MNKELLEHYYGDKLRVLFVVSGLIMVVSYPFFSSLINAPLSLSILGGIVLAVFAGLTNPKLKSIMVLDMIVSIVACLSFQYYAIFAYHNLSAVENINTIFFWVNQLLAIVFFFAIYLSTKTLRGALLAEK